MPNKSLKTVVITFNRPAFGQIRTYTIYRMLGTVDPVTNPLTNAKPILTVTVPPVQDSYTTFDNTAKTNVTYTYFVTSSLADGRQSPPSTAVVVTVKFQ